MHEPHARPLHRSFVPDCGPLNRSLVPNDGLLHRPVVDQQDLPGPQGTKQLHLRRKEGPDDEDVETVRVRHCRY